MAKQIELTQGYYTTVDDVDYEYLNQWKWHYDRHSRYAVRTINGSRRDKPRKITTVFMHRSILNTPKDLECDHIDGDRINNQKYNLRNCTSLQNTQNRSLNKNSISGYKGVGWTKKTKSFRVRIKANGIVYYLGSFLNVKEAALAYNEKALELHGEFARLNRI